MPSTAKPAGSRATPTAASISWRWRAPAGIGQCFDVRDEAGLADLAARLKTLNETLFARVAISAEEPPRVLPEKDGVALKQRFRAAARRQGLKSAGPAPFWTVRGRAFITPALCLPAHVERALAPR